VAEKLDVARSQTIQARNGIGVERAAEPRTRPLGKLPLLAIIKVLLQNTAGSRRWRTSAAMASRRTGSTWGLAWDGKR